MLPTFWQSMVICSGLIGTGAYNVSCSNHKRSITYITKHLLYHLQWFIFMVKSSSIYTSHLTLISK